jgi:hypothetical protein
MLLFFWDLSYVCQHGCVCCKSKSARHAPLLHITRKNDIGFFSLSVLWTTLGLFSAVDVSFIGFFHVSKGYARTTFQLHLMMSNTRWSKCKNRIFSLQWMISHSWTIWLIDPLITHPFSCSNEQCLSKKFYWNDPSVCKYWLDLKWKSMILQAWTQFLDCKFEGRMFLATPLG